MKCAKSYKASPCFKCQTCHTDALICKKCADTCHKDHNIYSAGFKSFECGCSAGKCPVACQLCDSPQAKPSSTTTSSTTTTTGSRSTHWITPPTTSTHTTHWITPTPKTTTTTTTTTTTATKTATTATTTKTVSEQSSKETTTTTSETVKPTTSFSETPSKPPVKSVPSFSKTETAKPIPTLSDDKTDPKRRPSFSNVCTGSYKASPCYKCQTCDSDVLICKKCADHCHKDHQIANIGFRTFECGCYAGKLEHPCTISAKLPDVVSPKATTTPATSSPPKTETKVGSLSDQKPDPQRRLSFSNVCTGSYKASPCYKCQTCDSDVLICKKCADHCHKDHQVYNIGFRTFECGCYAGKLEHPCTIPGNLPSSITPSPKPEPVKETPKPEPVKETPKPEPVKETPKPEPVKETPKPEPVKEEPKPEPVKETPKPDPQRRLSFSTVCTGSYKASPCYKCKTCDSDVLICKKCADHCHKDHQVYNIGFRTFECGCYAGKLEHPCTIPGNLPSSITPSPKPEPVKETPKPEPIKETPKPEPVKETPKPEPVKETPKPEPVKETTTETPTPYQNKPAVSKYASKRINTLIGQLGSLPTDGKGNAMFGAPRPIVKKKQDNAPYVPPTRAKTLISELTSRNKEPLVDSEPINIYNETSNFVKRGPQRRRLPTALQDMESAHTEHTDETPEHHEETHEEAPPEATHEEVQPEETHEEAPPEETHEEVPPEEDSIPEPIIAE